jgi:hypothetical protein
MQQDCGNVDLKLRLKAIKSVFLQERTTFDLLDCDLGCDTT